MANAVSGEVPRRSTLTEQAAEYLRRGILGGRWAGELPSEAVLGHELQISRVTLRRALAKLLAEGWIEAGGHGRHHRIAAEIPIAVAESDARTVRVLCPFSFWEIGGMMHSILHSLANRLSASGLRLEYEQRPRLFKKHSPLELERLTRRADTAAWVLMYATEPMQRWFAVSGVPCVVDGRLHEGLHLASLAVDNEAVARQAAAQLCRRGHREIVHLIDEFTSLADRLGAEAFRDEVLRLGGRVRMIEHDPEPPAVKRAVNSFLSSRPSPTAVYLTNPDVAVTALGQLLAAGVRIPRQFEMIAGWGDPVLQRTVPTISHYGLDGSMFGRRLAEIVLQRVRRNGIREHKEALQFWTGGTTR